jgi:hypothetical protein
MVNPGTTYESSRLWKLRADDFSDSYKAVGAANIPTWKSSPAVATLSDGSVSASGGYYGLGDGGVYSVKADSNTTFAQIWRVRHAGLKTGTPGNLRGSPIVADIDGLQSNGYEVIETIDWNSGGGQLVAYAGNSTSSPPTERWTWTVPSNDDGSTILGSAAVGNLGFTSGGSHVLGIAVITQRGYVYALSHGTPGTNGQCQ